jgi:type VI secretion system lysozyme-like protein
VHWPLTIFDVLLPGPPPSPRDRLLRDLERLLNSRAPSRPGVAGDRELTLGDYGLPAIAREELDKPERVAALCRLIEGKIERFEPRLRGAKVRPVGASRGRVHLRIEATLKPEAPPVPVAEAVLCPDGHFALDSKIPELDSYEISFDQ